MGPSHQSLVVRCIGAKTSFLMAFIHHPCEFVLGLLHHPHGASARVTNGRLSELIAMMEVPFTRLGCINDILECNLKSQRFVRWWPRATEGFP